jgi:hypothetical protein
MISLKYLIKRIKYRDPISYPRSIGVNVGENTRFIGMPNFGSEPWLVSIGNHVLLSFEVIFLTHDGSTWVFREKKDTKMLLNMEK